MELNPFKLIEDLINEHGSSAILGQRLLLLKDILHDLETKCANLQTQLADCIRENTQFRKQFDENSIPPEFIEYAGALFKKGLSGRYDPVVYCRRCKRVLWNTPDFIALGAPYECSTPGCSFKVNIHESLTSIAEKLNKLIKD